MKFANAVAGFAALAAATGAGALLGCSKGTAVGTIHLKVRLGDGYETGKITGLKLTLDGAGDAGLTIGASGVVTSSVAGFRFESQARNDDGDDATEYVVTFAGQNPFAAGAFDFDFVGTWVETVLVAVRCAVQVLGSTYDVASVEMADDGSPIRLVPGATSSVTCNVPCSPGTSCAGTIPPPVVAAVVPTSPANNNSPRVLGTATATDTISIHTDSACATPAVGSGSGSLFSTVGITVALADDATYKLFARAVSATDAGSPCSPTFVPYVEDSTRPAAPTALAVAPSGPASNNAPRISGQAEPLSGVRIFADSTCDGGALSAGSAAAFQDVGIAVAVPRNAATTLYATATDDAGNTSVCSAGVTYVEDSFSPTPVFAGTIPQSPANNNTPLVTGSAEQGATVRIFTDSACTALLATGTAAAFADGGIAVAIADDTMVTLYAQAADAVGNVSACTTTGVAYVEDSTPPVVANTRVRPDSPSTWRYPRVYGTVNEQGSTVSVYSASDCDAGLLATTSALQFADGGALVSLTPSSTTNLYVSAVDPAGNRSACQSAGQFQHREIPVAIGAGASHSCALTDGGGVKCWGLNAQGQLGNDAGGGFSSVPVNVFGLSSGVQSLSLGFEHTCAVLVAGGAKCWGANAQGQVGNGRSASSQTTPAAVTQIWSNVAVVAAGGGDTFDFGHACALSTTGALRCWGGLDTFGEIGDGTSDVLHLSPIDVVGVDGGAAAVATGLRYSCALGFWGNAFCWGKNDYFQLGNTFEKNELVPVEVVGSTSPFMAIAASGGTHTCALTIEGGVACWGYSASGALGGGVATLSPTPVKVYGLHGGVKALATGTNHSCAIDADGGVKCWGANNLGQLGDGTVTSRATPVSVVGLDGGVTSLVLGQTHTCARMVTGGVKCWGSNESGQVGPNAPVGGGAFQPTPVDVPGF